jgi:SAM-dependent methyltransferase
LAGIHEPEPPGRSFQPVNKLYLVKRVNMTGRTDIPVRENPGAWDAEYSRKGRLFGGSVFTLPGLLPCTDVLELGCGDGKTLSAMVQRGWKVTALDLSARAIVLARDAAGLPANLVIGDARAVPFRPETFDAVFAHHILGHMKEGDRDTISRGICRVIRPGGNLYFNDFSTRDFRFGKGSETEPGTFRRGNEICTHYFTPSEVADLFSRLAVVSVDYRDWTMRIRGRDLPRSEVTAVFRKC